MAHHLRGGRRKRRERRGRSCHLEGAGAGHHAAILGGVLDGPDSVPDGVLDLHERVLVGALRQDGHGLLVGAVLHERVFVLAQHMLVR